MAPTPDWVDLDRRHVWHPYTQMLNAPTPIAVDHAEGVYLYTADGRKILDGISSWWVNILGHSHPRLNAALARQCERMQQVIFAGTTNEPGARLAARLAEVTQPGLDHIFYSDNGSTAVEVGLKMASQYWTNRGEKQRTLFAGITNAYHGDTFGTMSVGGTPTFHEAFAPLLFEARHFHSAFSVPTDPPPAGSLTEHGDGSLEEILDRDGERIAGVVIEPMLQGAGGMLVWPASFLREVRELCDRHGVLLIADEVLTGFGRTGKMFACEHGPVTPDIVCLSKALTAGYLPLAATLATDAVYDAFLSEDRGKTLFHGHSYTGNALSCAVALESLAIFEDERILERVTRLESLMTRRLATISQRDDVANVRGIGGLAAIELRPRSSGSSGYLDSIGPRIAQEFLRRDILLRPLGNVLYFLPPFVITDDEAEHVFDAIEEVLDVVANVVADVIADV
jgi:adenosylmethionine-8-amino-7-oxononanoate aminotransferase